MVGKELEGGVCFGVTEFNTSQGLRVACSGVRAGQDNGLVTLQAGAFIDRSRVTAAVAGIGLATGHEEGGRQGQGEQALEVKIGAVHDVDSAGLGDKQVEDIDIVQFTV